MGLGDETVEKVKENLAEAPISEKLRAAVEFLDVFVPPERDFGIEDIEKMRSAGLSDQEIKDVMYASWCFMCFSKWADCFGFPLHTDRQGAAKALWVMPYTFCSVPDDEWPSRPLAKGEVV